MCCICVPVCKELDFIATTKILTHLSLMKEHSPLPTSGHPPATRTEIIWKKSVFSKSCHMQAAFFSAYLKTNVFITSVKQMKQTTKITTHTEKPSIPLTWFLDYRKHIPWKKKQPKQTKPKNPPPITCFQLCNILIVIKKSRPSGYFGYLHNLV